MPDLKFSCSDVAEEIMISINSLSVPVAKAAQAAIKEAGDILKTKARAHIRGAGFSRKWENAYRVTVYPTRGASIDAAAFGVFRSIHYSDIFATGGRITGKPMLWLPLPTTPKLDRRRAAANIKDYKRMGIKMVPMRSAGGKPLLGATLFISKARAKQKLVKVTKADLTRVEGAASGLIDPNNKKNKRLVSRTVPLFFGVSSINIRRRFSWAVVEKAVQALVPGLYERAISRLADK